MSRISWSWGGKGFFYTNTGCLLFSRSENRGSWLAHRTDVAKTQRNLHFEPQEKRLDRRKMGFCRNRGSSKNGSKARLLGFLQGDWPGFRRVGEKPRVGETEGLVAATLCTLWATTALFLQGQIKGWVSETKARLEPHNIHWQGLLNYTWITSVRQVSQDLWVPAYSKQEFKLFGIFSK